MPIRQHHFLRACALLVMLALPTLVHAQECLAELEPNDTPPTATALNGARCLEGTLPSQDQDAYRLVIGEEERFTRYRLVIEGPSGVLTKADVIDVAYTEDGSGVTGAETLFTFGTNDGRPAASDPFLLTPGSYTLGLSSSGGGDGYRVVLEPVDDAIAGPSDRSEGWVDELSASVAATDAGADAEADARADAGASIDWTVQRADTLWQIDVHVPLGRTADVVLVRDDGAVVDQGSARGTQSLRWSNLALQRGRYRIDVLGADWESAIVTASATGDPGAGGESEPNDTPDQADALPTDATTTGTVRAGDVDRYVFDVGPTLAAQVFDLRVETDVEVVVTLADDAGTVLQQRRGSGGALRSLRLPEGRYRLALTAEDEGAYALSFSAVGSPQAGVEEEPNDTLEAAYPLDDSLSVRGELGPQDVDVFRFAIDGSGGSYRVQVLARGGGVQRVTVRGRDGGVVDDVRVAEDERRIRLENVELPPGEYVLELAGSGTSYAVRMLNLGELAARPPDLEAEQDGSDETLEVETVPEDGTDAGDAPDREAAAQPDEADAPAAEDAVPSCAERLAGAPLEAGQDATFRFVDDATFACGDTVSTVVTDDGVRLDDKPAAFRFIWVAASRRGTVVKIDTDTGEILGEYWTAPVYDPLDPSMNPSRSVVDGNGNAWIGNRADAFEGMGSVVKIGLLENGQCVDRNGDGEIQTSQGLGDVLPWTNEGDADRRGGVSTAADECILAYVRVNATGIRHLSANGDNDVWVSGTGDQDYDLVDGETHQVARTEPGYGCGGYGGLIDREGILWSARPLLRWDPDQPLQKGTSDCDAGWTYGLGLGPDDRVWASDFGTRACRLTRSGEVDVCFDAAESDLGAGRGLGLARGVAVTDDGHAWTTFSNGDAVGRFDPEAGLVALIPVGATPTGVSIDARGKVWVTNVDSSNAMRIDPETNAVDLTVSLGVPGDPDASPYYGEAKPYTYSDMTGQLVFDPPEIGTWTTTLAGPTFRTEWRAIRYEADVPEGAEILVRVTASDQGAEGGARPVESGDAIDAVAANLVVSVTMRRAPDGRTPVLRRLDVDAVPQPLDPGSIEVRARPDLVASSNAIGVILDASGSMGQSLPEGVTRIEAARSVLIDLASSAFPTGVPLSMRVFGHLEPATCHMALELPLAPFEAEPFIATVRTFEPKLLSGTPLADALAAAGDDLAEADGRKMVVLVTDGEESCGGDPEAAIAALADRGIDTVNIVGFALDDDAVKERMRAWAELGGGRYADAGSGDELARVLNEILQPEFVITDPSGAEVARGRVNLGPVEVPSGVYDLEVLSTPRKRIQNVGVVESDVSLTVRLQEANGEP